MAGCVSRGGFLWYFVFVVCVAPIAARGYREIRGGGVGGEARGLYTGYTAGRDGRVLGALLTCLLLHRDLCFKGCRDVA